MKFIPETVSRKAGRLLLQGAKHSPRILFVAGVVGVVGTAILASKATLGVSAILNEHQDRIEDIKEVRELSPEKYTEEDATKDTAVLYVGTAGRIIKLYLPSIAVGTLTIACLTGAHNILSKRNVALTAAYAAVEKGFRDYRERVQNELGEEKDREFLYGGEKREIIEADEKGKVISTTEVISGQNLSTYARFFDAGSRQWSKFPGDNRFFLNCQQNAANDRLRMRGHIFLNEVYDMLDLPRSTAGSVVGWIWNPDVKPGDYHGDGYVDFGMYKDDPEHRNFINGVESSILLDFNVDGVIYDLIDKIGDR